MADLKWIKHDGGPMPVPGDAIIDVKLRGGGITTGWLASHYEWGELGSQTIVEYAIAEPSSKSTPPTPEPAIDAHYTKWAIEPMEFSMANKLDAMQHTVVKYVTRFRDKHGKRDLLAARHVIDMMIAREYPDNG